MKAVDPFLAGLGQERISGQLVDHVLQRVLERQNLPLFNADAGGPARCIAKAGGVIEQVPDGHGRVLRHGAHDLVTAHFRNHRHGGDLRQVLGNGVVQAHGPVIHQREDGGAGDRPALGIDPEHGVRLHRKARFAVAVSVRFQLHQLAVPGHAPHDAGAAAFVDQAAHGRRQRVQTRRLHPHIGGLGARQRVLRLDGRRSEHDGQGGTEDHAFHCLDP